MPVPRRRRSPARKGRQRAHKNLSAPAQAVCPHCQATKQPHRVCPSCGHYKDRVFKVEVTT